MVVILMGTLECSLLSPTAWRVIMTALKALDFYQAQQADHDAKLAREEQVSTFFGERSLKTADAILWETGIELALTPKEGE